MKMKTLLCISFVFCAPALAAFSSNLLAQSRQKSDRVSSSDLTSVQLSLKASTTVVISQAYGGGGGSTGTYLNDYVELKNISGSPQSLNGLSLMYGSSTGQIASTATNSFALPDVTLQPGQYYLVQLGPAGTGGVALPAAPDATTTNLSMSASNGKVALAKGLTPNTCGPTATPCTLSNAQIVDLVAWGTSTDLEGDAATNGGASLTSTQGNVRKNDGCTNTDNNNADFDVVTAPVPRNTASTAVSCSAGPAAKDVIADFNGDGLTDYAILRLSGGPADPFVWWIYPNRGTYFYNVAWGVGFDFQITGDFDGDTKDDLAVWRPGTIGRFYIIQSQSNTLRIEDFGQTGDDPSVVGDYNGDNIDDIAVYRAGVGAGNPSFWYWRPNPTTFFTKVPWGLEGDTVAPGDYDGDNRMDYVIFRPNGPNGEFWQWMSSGGFAVVPFGLADDTVVPGDYDGDGSDDLCVVRSDGGNWRWEFRASGTPGHPVSFEHWGVAATDIPVAGSYNRNESADFSVWREGTTSTFWSFNFVSREISFINWGVSGDVPVLDYATHD
jgi:hypothetical protein